MALPHLNFYARTQFRASIDRPDLPPLGAEDFEKRDLESERFLNVAPEIVSQLFQSLDPL